MVRKRLALIKLCLACFQGCNFSCVVNNTQMAVRVLKVLRATGLGLVVCLAQPIEQR